MKKRKNMVHAPCGSLWVCRAFPVHLFKNEENVGWNLVPFVREFHRKEPLAFMAEETGTTTAETEPEARVEDLDDLDDIDFDLDEVENKIAPLALA